MLGRPGRLPLVVSFDSAGGQSSRIVISLFAQKEEFRNESLNSAISKQRITRVSCSKISQKRLNLPEVSKNTVFDIGSCCALPWAFEFQIRSLLCKFTMLDYADYVDKTDTFCNFKHQI